MAANDRVDAPSVVDEDGHAREAAEVSMIDLFEDRADPLQALAASGNGEQLGLMQREHRRGEPLGAVQDKVSPDKSAKPTVERAVATSPA
jgi:hypothetical protein